MFYYKIVTKTARYSCILGASTKYSLQYKKGTVVEAVPGTLGIFVFETKDATRNFCSNRNKWRIVLVRGYGKKMIPNSIADVGIDYNCERFLNNFYNGDWVIRMSAPQGTVLFKKVKVMT